MKLEIYHSIIHGSLQPQNSQLPANYPEISHILDSNPTSLKEIEGNLILILKDSIMLHFKDETAVNINQYINNPQYTPIIEDHYQPIIKLKQTPAKTPMDRFYRFIITNEAKRIQLQLYRSVEILKDDICSKQEVKDTLSLLARLAKNIVEHTHPCEILNFLLSIITKTYFEITLIFDSILAKTDYISFSDFCTIKLQREIDIEFENAHNTAITIHQSQQALNQSDIEKINLLLPTLYDELYRDSKNNILIEVICALENFNYLFVIDNTSLAIPEIIEKNFVRTKFREQTQKMSEDFNILSNAREVMIQIDEHLECIPDLQLLQPEYDLPLSIPRLIKQWLLEQKELYQQNLAQMFVPTIQHDTKTTQNPKSTIQRTNTQDLKSKALKFYSFLSGYDRFNKKIMSEDSFSRLTTYINTLIDTESLPEDIIPIPQTALTNEYLRYTFYLIHKELYTTRPIRQNWIELLKLVFTQFKDVETETIRKKFSTPPTHYDKDIEEIKNRKQK